MKSPPYFKIGAIILILAVFFLILNLTSLSGGVKNFFYSISLPIQKAFWGTGERLSNFFGSFGEAGNLKKENEGLKLKIQELLIENINLQELKKENETLRNALNIGFEKEFQLALAEATAKDIAQDFILIDKGSKEGISKGMAVITEQKVLIGKIYEVNDNYSKVMLISNKDSSYGVKVVDTQILGEVKGDGNSKLLLDFIPLESEIKKGDLIMTTSLAGIPEGLLVGEINEVKRNDVEPFQKADIKPTHDIRKIDKLFIILNF